MDLQVWLWDQMLKRPGMCEVIAEMWLEWCTTASKFETRLRDKYLNMIRTGTSQVIKNGYKKVKRVVDKYGLNFTLNYMELWKALPSE